jgi:hypothetical protein
MLGLGPGSGRFRLLIKKNTIAPRTMKPPTTPPAIPPIAPDERPDDPLAGDVGVGPALLVLDEAGLSEKESVVVGTGVVDIAEVVVGAVVAID